jgi:translation initiation factor 4E
MDPEGLLDESPHYLHTKWVLWFDASLQSGKRSGAQDWAKNMKKMSTFETIEEFWGTMHNVPPPSKLPVGCNYHLFREGIMPLWEDGHNIKGGKWTYNEKRDKGMSTPHIDNLWLYSMMSLVGETYPDSKQICGAVCSLRQKQDRVAVWTKDANDEEAYNKVGEKFRVTLNKAIGGNCFRF